MSDHISLELLEKKQFAPGPSPYEAPALRLSPEKENRVLPGTVRVLSLNGVYEMAADGEDESRLSDDAVWEDAVPANVPCTVASALYEAGKIPDPMFGKNDSFAREAAYHTRWLRKPFDYDGSMKNPRLVFDGVCHEADFWLNGVYLGHHAGMFAGPEFAVADIIKPHNTLLVKIANSPADRKHYSPYADYDDGWKNGVVLNCVYGWHYASIPSRGIWQGV
ncbi:MAG: beta-mannosidase, partial [Clostridia bacterium]|nr:beta-mannosidase [Clostridia bacterium]